MTAIRIDDLAAPRLPPEIAWTNRLARPFASRVTLAPEALLETASRRAGLHDYGDPWFREPLGVLVDALEREAGLSPFGRFATRQHLLQLLTSRLRVEALIARHPEILDGRIARPIVIAGLPRTGTSHLFDLLSRRAGLRWLPYWESLEPVPPPGEEAGRDGRDPRIARAERSLRFLDRAMPLFRAMHEFSAAGPHEEIQLLALAFSTQLFEASYFVPGYGEWYRTTDQTPAYRYLERCLKALQWLRRGSRWLLKTPQHLENLGPLAAVFPDASFVQTHRDPVRITASLATMIAYGARMQHARPDPVAIGRHWARRVEDMMRASIHDRPCLPEAQVTDLRFDEFMKDPVAAVARVLGFCGEAFDSETERAVRELQAANPAGRHGRIDYRLEDVGLDADERRQALGFYSEHFGVPWEA